MTEASLDTRAGLGKSRLASGPRLFVFFCLLAILPRLWVLQVALHRERPVTRHQDSGGYLEAAESLSHGRGYSGFEGKPVFWWPPGYSFFLAANFRAGIASPDHPAGALLTQIFLASLVAGMASLLALELGGPYAASLAGALMVIEPTSIAYADVLLSETLYTFLLMLAALAWVQWWRTRGPGRLVLFACLVGALPLVRPMALYLWMPLGLLVWLLGPGGRHRAWLALLFAGVALAPIVSWTLRNYAYLRLPVFATVSQFNEALFARSVEDLAGESRPATSLRQPWQEGFGQEEGRSFDQVMRERDRYFRRVIARHPFLACERSVLTGLGILGVPDKRLPDLLLRQVPQTRERGVTGYLRWLVELGWLGALLLIGMSISVLGFLALCILALRCATWERRRQALLALIAVLVVYHLLLGSSTMYQGDRFRVPVVPMLAVALSCLLVGRAREASGEREH